MNPKSKEIIPVQNRRSGVSEERRYARHFQKVRRSADRRYELRLR